MPSAYSLTSKLGAANDSGTAVLHDIKKKGPERRHRLFALIRERYGEKYTKLSPGVFREAAHWLIDGPLDSVDTPQENGYL